MTERPPVITISDKAVARIKHLLDDTDEPVIGLRVKVDKGGCSGLSYNIDYAKEEIPGDEKITQDGITIYIEPTSIIHLLGSQMDFHEEKLASRFIFNNPNKTGECGCGESFTTN